MLIQTVLNDCHGFAFFKYAGVIFDREKKKITIEMSSKQSSKARCSRCETKCPTYDHQSERRFKFVPLFGYQVTIIYIPRRVQCTEHGVVIEWMPWALGKRPICRSFALFLASWSKTLSWTDVARKFHVSWDIVFISVKYVVDYGLLNRCLDKIESIGIDEILFRRGYHFVTLVFEITEGSKRLLWIGEGRKSKTLLRFFRILGKAQYCSIKIVCSDMWAAYLKVVKKKLPNALHILDRFHVMKLLNKAIDQTRRIEFRALQEEGKENILTSTRWLFLKSPGNLTDKQSVKLSDLVDQNLKTYKVYLMRELFQKLWTITAARHAETFIKGWCIIANRSKIDPLKRVAKTLTKHLPYLLNWFKTERKISNGTVEGFNNKVKLIMRRAFGFSSFSHLEIALYHNLGNLTEPKMTHSFV